MTPEPTGGVYADYGAKAFVKKFGYADKKGRAGRWNFGGIYKVNRQTATTGLKTMLFGYDHESKKVIDADGYLALVGPDNIEAATWSFGKLFEHWLKKHSSACYVPSIKREEPSTAYHYGNQILLCEKTDFVLFLEQLSLGNIWLDPALKVFDEGVEGVNKTRNQFRIKAQNVAHLYKQSEIVRL